MLTLGEFVRADDGRRGVLVARSSLDKNRLAVWFGQKRGPNPVVELFHREQVRPLAVAERKTYYH